MKKLNNKGITLMALVITIILLIILASIGTYSGIQVVKSAQFTAFSTELKIMQTQVNSLYEKNKNNEKILLNNVETEIEDIGTAISSSSEVQTQANKAFIASGITDTSDYKYFDTDTIKSLNIEGVEGEFLVNIDKRSVVSYDGFEYEGKTYYTLEQLPDGLYNVEHNTSEQQPDFNVDYELLENGKCKISVNNINYNGNINKWQVKYKKENETDWKTSNSNSFIIDEVGNYRVKIANGNTQSNEKQIVAKSSFLPSEFQEVEYIESTGTQWIDTGFSPDNESGLVLKLNYTQRPSSPTKPFGVYYNNNANRWYGLNPSDQGNKWSYGWNDWQELDINFSLGFHEILINLNNNRKAILDNQPVYVLPNYTFGTGKSAYLFALNNGSNNKTVHFSKVQLYLCRLFDNNKEVRKFIPCYSTTTVRDIDEIERPKDTIGLYDIVNNQFYTNQGTGDFEKGDDVIAGNNTNNDMIIIINDL